MKILKRFLIGITALTFLTSGLTGCKEGGKPVAGKNSSLDVHITKLQEALKTAKDTSELPTWEGPELKLTLWRAHGTGGGARRISENDVVNPEIKRVTGVTFDAEKSFDNGGEVIDAKLGKIVISRDFPDLILTPDKTHFVEMASAGLFWDLSGLIDKYGTYIKEKNLNTKVYSNIMDDLNITADQDKKVFALPVRPNQNVLKANNPDFDFTELEEPASELPYVWVRDDILKQIYPNAKTQKDIEDIYMRNGAFSKEEILDIPIDSKEEFIDFLYRIDGLNIKEGNKNVETFYTHNGSDNWPLLTQFGGLFGWHVEFTKSDCNYFAYFDKETKNVEMMYKQPFFKDSVKLYNKLIRDGVASSEALIDSSPIFREKVSNGLYAVLYSISETDPAFIALKKANKPYDYRKVYLNIRQNKDKFVFTENINPLSRAGDCVSIFKDSVSEESLPQIVTLVNYLLSDQGQKLQIWGPESAGLFTVDSEGKRIYKDTLLEQDILYNANNDRMLYYNLGGENVAWPGYLGTTLNGNIFKPTGNNYPVERKNSNASKVFNYGRIEPFVFEQNCNPAYSSLQGKVAEFDQFWSARQSFESSLKKVFAAASDSEFEKAYQELLGISESNGMTEEAIKKIDLYYKETINPQYKEYLK